MLRGCQLGQTAAVSGYRCQNCEKRFLAYLAPDAEKAGRFFDCKLYGQDVQLE